MARRGIPSAGGSGERDVDAGGGVSLPDGEPDPELTRDQALALATVGRTDRRVVAAMRRAHAAAGGVRGPAALTVNLAAALMDHAKTSADHFLNAGPTRRAGASLLGACHCSTARDFSAKISIDRFDGLGTVILSFISENPRSRFVLEVMLLLCRF